MERVRIAMWLFVAVAAYSCGQPSHPLKTLSVKKYQIWQSDDYPDSIFKNKSISDNSKWLSAIAYNIILSKDSFEFKGWHESHNGKLRKISATYYRTKGSLDTLQYWDFIFENPDKLLVREVWKGSDPRVTPYFSYHKTDELLTQDSLKRRIAKEIFAGKYKVLYNDTLTCDNEFS